jgi:ABC-type transport system substrate-binding protein
VTVDIPKTRKEFEDKMLKRQYDVLLFGESLLDNLDSYPYWHSSQMQDTSGDPNQLKLDAFNLSQYASFDADALLLKIRQSSDGSGRKKALTDLNEIIKRDIPAIFLYSPLSIFGYRDDVGGVDIGTPSVHSDRLLTINRWYVQTDRQFKEGKSWWSFFGWLWSIL